MTATAPHTDNPLRNLVAGLEDTFGQPVWINVRLHGGSDTPWLKLGNETPAQALASILRRLNKSALSVTLVKTDAHLDLWGRDATGKPTRLATIYHADLAPWAQAHQQLTETEAR